MINDVSQLGTILGVWAHPDDETFTAGGIMAAAAANGQTVICVTATRGEKGVQDANRWPADQLGDIRSRELADALAILGCTTHHLLGYEDGQCAEIEEGAVVARIRELIEQYKPDTILSFGPDGLTGHPDHQAASRWAVAAAGDIPVYGAVIEQGIYENYLKQIDQKFNFFFNIPTPPLKKADDCQLAFRLTPELCRQKEAALKAMPSQYAILFESAPTDFIDQAFGVECFVRL